MTTIAFKIMERTASADYFKTLFHGNFGTRTILSNKYISAQIREEARDEAGSTTYRSGWHTFSNHATAKKYLKRFETCKAELCIVMCGISGNVRRKATNSDMYLSDGIILFKEVRDVLKRGYSIVQGGEG